MAGGDIYLSSCDALLGGAVVSGNAAPEGGGAFSTGASTVSVCASLFFNNRAAGVAVAAAAVNASAGAGAGAGSSSARGLTAALVGGGGYGGGWAVLDPLSDVQLCDAPACAVYISAAGGRTVASAAARLPFSATLGTLVAQAARAQRLLAGPAPAPPAALARPLAPGTAAARPPADASAAALLAALLSAAAALEPNSTNCAWAGNAAAGPGGDVSVRASRPAAAVAAAFPPLVYLADSVLFASASAAAGGAVYASAQPVSLSALAIVGAVAGDVYACGRAAGSGSGPASACALAASTLYDGVAGSKRVRVARGGAEETTRVPPTSFLADRRIIMPFFHTK